MQRFAFFTTACWFARRPHTSTSGLTGLDPDFLDLLRTGRDAVAVGEDCGIEPVAS